MIEVVNVTKKFGDFTAIQDLNFKVSDGSIYGLIGYNRAGKTTLLKTITGVYKPDGGEVRLDGENAFDNAKMKQQEGAACRLCEVVCPVPNPRTAIVIRDGVPVIGRGCVGCGACAEVCPEHIIEIKARISFASLYEGK